MDFFFIIIIPGGGKGMKRTSEKRREREKERTSIEEDKEPLGSGQTDWRLKQQANERKGEREREGERERAKERMLKTARLCAFLCKQGAMLCVLDYRLKAKERVKERESTCEGIISIYRLVFTNMSLCVSLCLLS